MRTTLVATAVNFLKNERIQSSSDEQKREFLEKKGLTSEEITEAFRLSASHSIAMLNPQNTAIIEAKSTWNRFVIFFRNITLLAGSAYILYKFYKAYLFRYFNFNGGKTSCELMLEKLVKSNEVVNSILKEVVFVINEVKQQVVEQRNQRNFLKDDNINASSLKEVRDEMKSIKALLLSRNQFPPPPPVTNPILPAWQLEKKNETRSRRDNQSKAEEDNIMGSHHIDNQQRNNIVDPKGGETELEIGCSSRRDTILND